MDSTLPPNWVSWSCPDEGVFVCDEDKIELADELSLLAEEDEELTDELSLLLSDEELELDELVVEEELLELEFSHGPRVSP